MLQGAQIQDNFLKRYARRILTIDSHTGGEPTRLVVGGIGSLPGDTMPQKCAYFRQHFDRVRLQLTREPRGHRDMVAAVVTEPVNSGSHFGLFYMDARRYPHLCGHATMGAVTTLIELGALRGIEDGAAIMVDTPSGVMTARVNIRGTCVEAVAIGMVPSFVYATEQPLEIPSCGRLLVDLVCVGGFFAMVDARQIDLALTPANSNRLIELGMAVTEAANAACKVRHPQRPDVNSVDVTEFYAETTAAGDGGQSVVVYGEAHMDRSPCGTGTAAKMTLLHHHGRLGLNQTYLNRGPFGTTFEGRLIASTPVGALPAVVAEVSGSAQITGMQMFVLDDRDPFPEGFLL